MAMDAGLVTTVETIITDFALKSKSLLATIKPSNLYRVEPHYPIEPLKYSDKSGDLATDYNVVKLVNDERLKKLEQASDRRSHLDKENLHNIDNMNIDEIDTEVDSTYSDEPLYSLRKRRRRRFLDGARPAPARNRQPRTETQTRTQIRSRNPPHPPSLRIPHITHSNTNNSSGHGNIDYTGYHDYIYDSNVLWNFYISNLSTNHELTEDVMCTRRFFFSWKKYSWVRILRIKRARQALIKWNFLAKNNQVSRPARKLATKHLLGKTFKQLLENSKRIDYAKRRKLDAAAGAFNRNQQKRRFFSFIDSELVYKRNLILFETNLTNFYKLNFLVRTCFECWGTFARSLLVSKGAEASRVLKLLRANVVEKQRLSVLLECAENYGDYMARKRGVKYLSNNATVRKNFRRKLKEAFKLPAKSLYKKYIKNWVLFIHIEREERRLKFVSAALLNEMQLKRMVFNKIKRKYVQFKNLMVAQVDFKLWKLKNGMKKLRIFVKYKRAIHKFEKNQGTKSEKWLKFWVMTEWKRRWMVVKRGGEVREKHNDLLVLRSLRFWEGVNKSDLYAGQRRTYRKMKMFVGWYRFAMEEKGKREGLKRLVKKFWRHQILKTATNHGLAINFFGMRCGFAMLGVTFRGWRKYVVRKTEAKLKIFVKYGHLRLKELRIAMGVWKAVSERVGWQSACLTIGVKRWMGKVLREWRENAKREKKSRLLCEWADRKFRERALQLALKKILLASGVRKTRRSRGEIASKYLFRKRVLLAFENLAIEVGKGKHRDVRSALAISFFAKKGLVRGLKQLSSVSKKERLRKVATAVAFVMYRKGYLVKSFKGWVNEVCKMVGLRLAIKAGSRLQKLLAMKRWKVGCMLVLNRRRYKRKLLLGWKRVVEWEKELLRVKMLKRYWMVVVGSCRGMMEKRRRVERGGRGVVVLRKGELLRAWRNSYKAELFRRGRGSRRRSLRLLARWKISSGKFKRLAVLFKEWLGRCEAVEEGNGGKSVGMTIWRMFASTIEMRRNRIVVGCEWVGVVVLQRIMIYWKKWKIWWVERRHEGKLNEAAMCFWRLSLMKKVKEGWREVRAERLLDESNNLKCLDFWYVRLLRASWDGWVERTSYFVKIKEEALRGQMRAGFEMFCEGVMSKKVYRVQGAAAERIREGKTRKLLRRIIRRWLEWGDFEKTERGFREVRDKERELVYRVFLDWRIRVHAMVLTRMTYKDLHDDRFVGEMIGVIVTEEKEGRHL